jgi:hypothetical protein
MNDVVRHKLLLPIGPAPEGPHTGVIYSRLFKYTQQHTVCFTENQHPLRLKSLLTKHLYLGHLQINE